MQMGSQSRLLKESPAPARSPRLKEQQRRSDMDKDANRKSAWSVATMLHGSHTFSRLASITQASITLSQNKPSQTLHPANIPPPPRQRAPFPAARRRPDAPTPPASTAVIAAASARPLYQGCQVSPRAVHCSAPPRESPTSSCKTAAISFMRIIISPFRA